MYNWPNDNELKFQFKLLRFSDLSNFQTPLRFFFTFVRFCSNIHDFKTIFKNFKHQIIRILFNFG